MTDMVAWNVYVPTRIVKGRCSADWTPSFMTGAVMPGMCVKH